MFKDSTDGSKNVAVGNNYLRTQIADSLTSEDDRLVVVGNNN